MLSITVAVLGVVGVLAAILIPATTSATRSIVFDAPIEAVWAIYTEPARQPDWRSGVGTVSVSEDGQSWIETLSPSGMTIHFEILEKTRPHRLHSDFCEIGKRNDRHLHRGVNCVAADSEGDEVCICQSGRVYREICGRGKGGNTEKTISKRLNDLWPDLPRQHETS